MIDRGCLSLNNNCNLNCRYCHFNDKQGKKSVFNKQQIIRIINNIHEYCISNNLKAFKLGIVGAGEPMIYKNLIFDILDYVKNNNYNEFNMYTITNGTLLSKEDLQKFYNYKDYIKICFSLDGYKEIHNYGRDKYDDVINTINLYKIIFKESPAINATVNALSILNYKKLIEFFENNELYNVTFSKLVGYTGLDLYISDKEFENFMKNVKESKLCSRQFNIEKKYDCTMYGKLCGVGRTNIFFTPEGIFPCGRFYKNEKYLLGDIDFSINQIEKNVLKMIPVCDGECYYDKYVEVKK